MLLFLLVLQLCCSALEVTYYAQYYAQEQKLLSDYYAVYCMCYMKLTIIADCYIRVYL